jgi:hypothetical protein
VAFALPKSIIHFSSLSSLTSIPEVDAKSATTCKLWSSGDYSASFTGRINDDAGEINEPVSLKLTFDDSSGGKTYDTTYDVNTKKFTFDKVEFTTESAVAKLTISNATGSSSTSTPTKYLTYEETLLFTNGEPKLRSSRTDENRDWLNGTNPAFQLAKSPFTIRAYSGKRTFSGGEDIFANEAGYSVSIYERDTGNNIVNGVTIKKALFGGIGGFYENVAELTKATLVSNRNYYATYTKDNVLVGTIPFTLNTGSSNTLNLDIFPNLTNKTLKYGPVVVTGKVLVRGTKLTLPGTNVSIEQNGKSITIKPEDSFFGTGASNQDYQGISGSRYMLYSGLVPGKATITATYAYNQYTYKADITLTNGLSNRDISLDIPLICGNTKLQHTEVLLPGIGITLKQENKSNPQQDVKYTANTDMSGEYRTFEPITPNFVHGFQYKGYTTTDNYSFYSVDARTTGNTCNYQKYDANSTCNFANTFKKDTPLFKAGNVNYQIVLHPELVSLHEQLQASTGTFRVGSTQLSYNPRNTNTKTNLFTLAKDILIPQTEAQTTTATTKDIQVKMAKVNQIKGKILPPDGKNWQYSAYDYRIKVTSKTNPDFRFETTTDTGGNFVINFAWKQSFTNYEIKVQSPSSFSHEDEIVSDTISVKFEKGDNQIVLTEIKLNKEIPDVAQNNLNIIVSDMQNNDTVIAGFEFTLEKLDKGNWVKLQSNKSNDKGHVQFDIAQFNFQDEQLVRLVPENKVEYINWNNNKPIMIKILGKRLFFNNKFVHKVVKSSVGYKDCIKNESLNIYRCGKEGQDPKIDPMINNVVDAIASFVKDPDYKTVFTELPRPQLIVFQSLENDIMYSHADGVYEHGMSGSLVPGSLVDACPSIYGGTNLGEEIIFRAYPFSDRRGRQVAIHEAEHMLDFSKKGPGDKRECSFSVYQVSDSFNILSGKEYADTNESYLPQFNAVFTSDICDKWYAKTSPQEMIAVTGQASYLHFEIVRNNMNALSVGKSPEDIQTAQNILMRWVEYVLYPKVPDWTI